MWISPAAKNPGALPSTFSRIVDPHRVVPRMKSTFTRSLMSTSDSRFSWGAGERSGDTRPDPPGTDDSIGTDAHVLTS
jgi:hypothetical protein